MLFWFQLLLKIIFEIIFIEQFISLKSYLNIYHRLSKLLSVELVNVISELQSKHCFEMTCRQLKCPRISEEEWYSLSLYIHLKVAEGQVGLSTPLYTEGLYELTSFRILCQSLQNHIKELYKNLHHRFFSFSENHI